MMQQAEKALIVPMNKQKERTKTLNMSISKYLHRHTACTGTEWILALQQTQAQDANPN